MKSNTVTRTLFAALALSVFLLSSCDQAPLYVKISNETKPKDALIEGNPGAIVDNGTDLFVTNGYIWKYNTAADTWAKVTRPDSGKVLQLAATTGKLYALTAKDNDEDSTEQLLWQSTDDGANWARIAGNSTYTKIGSIHAANDTLFVLAVEDLGSEAKDSDYHTKIFYYDGSALTDTGIGEIGNSGGLQGVAYLGTTYYLATADLGIFEGDTLGSISSTAVSGTTDKGLRGIIATSGTSAEVIAVGSIRDGTEGYLLYGTGTSFTSKKWNDDDLMFTGALCLYDNDNNGTPDYLLTGLDEGDDYSYGYNAFALSTIGEVTPTALDVSDGLSVDDSDQYDSSLGVIAVEHLYQYSDGTGSTGTNILFASTDLEGLWSTVSGGDWEAVEEE